MSHPDNPNPSPPRCVNGDEKNNCKGCRDCYPFWYQRKKCPTCSSVGILLRCPLSWCDRLICNNCKRYHLKKCFRCRLDNYILFFFLLYI